MTKSRIWAFDWYQNWWPWIKSNDLEWYSGCYFALFHRIPQLWGQLFQSGWRQTI